MPPAQAASRLDTDVSNWSPEQVAEYERITGWLWGAIAVLQICAVVTALAGTWNLFVAHQRLTKVAPAARNPCSNVPEDFYRPLSGLVIIGLVNLFFGAVFGVLLIAVDAVVRKRVLNSQHLYNGPTSGSLGI